MARDHLRIVGSETPWTDPKSYRPDTAEMLRERIAARRTWRTDLADDWHGFWDEVAAEPAHHFLFGLLVVVAWTVLLVAPTLLGAWG
jgi:hypothetical protein